MKPQIAGLAVLLLAASAVPIASSAPEGSDVETVSETSSAESELHTRGWVIDTLRISGTQEPGVRHLRASGRIRLHLEQVWRMLTDSSPEAAGSWPGIKECDVEYTNADTVIARYVVAVPVFKDRRYRLRNVTDAPHHQALFVQVPGYGNVKAIRGSWTITALGDSLTRADYDVDVDPGVRLIPGFIVNWATKRAVPRLFAHIHDRASRMSWAQNGPGPKG